LSKEELFLGILGVFIRMSIVMGLVLDNNWNFDQMLKSEGDTPEDGISFED
jgi:hypothetical protein